MQYLSATTDLLEWLHEQLPHAEGFTAVSGFVSKSGIDLLHEPLLELLGRGGRVHITTGVHEGQLSASDAYAALTLFEPYPDTASLSVATDPDALLHTKTYVLHYPDGRHGAYIGSANLTAGGLRRSVEAGLLLDSELDSAALDALLSDMTAQSAAATRVTREALPRLLPPTARVASSSRGVRLGRRPAAEGSRRFDEHLEDALSDLENIGTGQVAGVATGFVDLDGLTHGLQPGQMIVIGGRPGAGKSTLAVDIARHAAVKNAVPVALFSLEMGRQELVLRILSAESRVPLHYMRAGQMSDDDWNRMAVRMAQIADMPLIINDMGHLTVEEIHAESRRLIEDHGVRLIVVDYLQLLRPVRRSDRHVEVAEISRGLKLMARDLEVPVVVASQLNRASETRSDKKPQLSDLRESGAVEQDSDIVILIHRPDMSEREHPRAGEADLMVVKHRNGPTATITVAFQGHYSRFVDMNPNPPPRA